MFQSVPERGWRDTEREKQASSGQCRLQIFGATPFTASSPCSDVKLTQILAETLSMTNAPEMHTHTHAHLFVYVYTCAVYTAYILPGN